MDDALMDDFVAQINGWGLMPMGCSDSSKPFLKFYMQCIDGYG